MNDQNPPAKPLPAYQPDPAVRKSGKPVVAIVLSALVVIVALLILGGIKLYRVGAAMSDEATLVSNQFLADLNARNYKAAYDLFTPETQATSSASDLKDVQTLADKHGTLFISKSPIWAVSSFNGVTSITLQYKAGQPGQLSEVVVLLKTPSGYRVNGYRYTY